MTHRELYKEVCQNRYGTDSFHEWANRDLDDAWVRFYDFKSDINYNETRTHIIDWFPVLEALGKADDEIK